MAVGIYQGVNVGGEWAYDVQSTPAMWFFYPKIKDPSFVQNKTFLSTKLILVASIFSVMVTPLVKRRA